MFGRDKTDLNEPMTTTNVPVQTADDIAASSAPVVTDPTATLAADLPAVDTPTPVTEPAPETPVEAPATEPTAPAVDAPSEPATESAPEVPAEPATPEVPVLDIPEPEALLPASTEVTEQMPENPLGDEPLNVTEDTVAATPAPTDLSALKMQALQELSPLIGQLEQTPEEKYETANMIYRETGDQTMLSAVFEAAKNLSDDRAKAAAIYDVVKKINSL